MIVEIVALSGNSFNLNFIDKDSVYRVIDGNNHKYLCVDIYILFAQD